MRKKTVSPSSISRKFRAHLEEILRILPDATFAIDLRGTVIAWNPAIERMTGVAHADMVGRGDYEYALPFYGKREPVMIDLVLGGRRDHEKRYRFVRREGPVLVSEIEVPQLRGKRAYLRVRACAIRNSQGRIVGAIETIRDVIDFKRTEEELRRAQDLLTRQKTALEQRNVDLRDILSQVESEKNRMQEQIRGNVGTLLLPILDKIELKWGGGGYVALLRDGLAHLVSPFGRRISDRRYRLTSREIEICNLIKNGMTGKEISRLLGLSFQTVEMHRKNIRRKLGIAHRDVNMETFLRDL